MREPDATSYRLTTWWHLDAPLEPVWNAVAHADGWSAWWPGVTSVTLAPGDAQGLGAVRRYTCRSALPLRLSFIAQVTRIVPQQLIEGRACGDLVGTGRCRLACERGRTTVCFDWQVHAASAWLNRLAPLVHPLLRWNHDRLMQAGGGGLERHLARGAAMSALPKARTWRQG